MRTASVTVSDDDTKNGSQRQPSGDAESTAAARRKAAVAIDGVVEDSATETNDTESPDDAETEDAPVAFKLTPATYLVGCPTGVVP